jgi:hypothetical protein
VTAPATTKPGPKRDGPEAQQEGRKDAQNQGGIGKTVIDASPALLPFLKHAKKYGVEFVYESAKTELSPRELCVLANELSRIDKKWKLDQAQRIDLVVRLSELGTPDKEIRELVGISQPTLRKFRETAELNEDRDGPVKPPSVRSGPQRVPVQEGTRESISFTSDAENASGEVAA